MAEPDAASLRAMLERERELRCRAEEALARHSRELEFASEELMRQADALIERDRLANQMAIARRIQLSIQPPPLVTASYEVASAMDAADAVGGDFCDVHARDGVVWLAIGDVTGHGIDAGLVMLMAQSSFALAIDTAGDPDPSSVLERVNRVLYDNVRLRMHRDDHMTFVAVRARSDGRLDFAGAHDVDLLVVHPDGTTDTHYGEGTWLAMTPVLRGVQPRSVTLRPGDLLVMATDGLVDCPGPEAELYSMERLVDSAVRERHRSPGEIVDVIRGEVAVWRSAAPARAATRLDDVTLIVARYRGQQPAGSSTGATSST